MVHDDSNQRHVVRLLELDNWKLCSWVHIRACHILCYRNRSSADVEVTVIGSTIVANVFKYVVVINYALY
jgi:hypothetical protein